MTDDDIDAAYAAKQAFLEKVRTAYRELQAELTAEQFDYIRYSCQDDLSLFSPWMNA